MTRPITFVDETDPLGPPADAGTATPLDATNLNTMQDTLMAHNSTYKRLMFSSGPITTAAASGNKYFPIGNNANNTNPTPGATSSAFPILNLVATRLAVTGLTTKLFLEAIVTTLGTGPGVTITTGLYPLTVVAGAPTLGTVVPNSTAATTATPATNSVIPVNSGDFTLPADGAYTFGVTLSGTPSANFQINALLSYHNV